MWTYPRVVHPMVFTQAETGRKVLNVSPGFAEGILELGGPDGDALLREVIAHCTDPATAWFHDWRDGDMVLWDNWRVLHEACGCNPEEERVVHRTTIKGDYGLGSSSTRLEMLLLPGSLTAPDALRSGGRSRCGMSYMVWRAREGLRGAAARRESVSSCPSRERAARPSSSGRGPRPGRG